MSALSLDYARERCLHVRSERTLLVSHCIFDPTEDAQPLSSKPVTSLKKVPPQRTSDTSRSHRGWIIAGAVVGVLVVIFYLAVYVSQEPIRRYVEREANEKLPDFQFTIREVDLHPLNLSVELHDVVVRQQAHLEPALANIPTMTVDATFLPLLTGTLDASLHLDHPVLAATSTQIDTVLQTPQKEQVKEQAIAWQDTLRTIMPVRASFFVSKGEIRYQSEPMVEDVKIEDLDVTVTHVTNRSPADQLYPSPVHVSAHLPPDARIELEGRADFLAKPDPRLEAQLKITRLALESLLPILQKYNVQFRRGTLDLVGQVKHVGVSTVVELQHFLLEDAKVDYVHAAETKLKEVAQAKKGAQKVKEVHQDPTLVVKVQHGTIVHSEVGFVNTATSPDYRVYMAEMNFEMENFSNRPEEGLGTMKLTGKFMGSGPTVVRATFRPEKPTPDFTFQVRIVKTKVQQLNNLLRAYGRLDAKDGTFAFFSEMSVKNNKIEGYAKPFLQDVEMYDPQQDKNKAATQKLYEAVVGGVLDLFKNQRTHEVATKTDVSGPIDNPHASTLQVLEKLVQNAFFKAILPGFKERTGRA